MDEIFARPILKLLGAAFMGAMFALVGCGALIALCGITPSAPTVAINNRAPDALLADSLSPRNRMAWARAGFAPPSGWEYSVPPMNEMQSPARREKSVSEMEDKRSSSCPAAFRSLV